LNLICCILSSLSPHVYLSSTFFFLFYSPRPHPDLLSFPTRRSSDLHPAGADVDTLPLVIEVATVVDVLEVGVKEVNLASTSHCRSEEHTSELQSPDHLVCRLLLEKKKKTKKQK